MSARRRSAAFGPRAFELALVVFGLAALAFSACRGRLYEYPTEDEREYLYAAANLARSGTLSFAPPGAAAPAPDSYREPGYPFLVATFWRTARLTPPDSAVAVDNFFAQAPLYRSIRWLNVALLALAAAASGWSAWRLGGARAGAAAFLLVAASPALHERSVMIMTEVAAAAGIAVLAGALVAAAEGRVWGTRIATAVAATLPLLRAEALLLVPLAGLAAWWSLAPEPEGRRGRRWRAAAAALALAALPGACWMVRNQLHFGVSSLSDRSGLALAVRASLDDEVARVGIVPAILVWTPLDSARARAKKLAPSSTLADYRWTGRGNFFTQTIRNWRRERAVPGADPLEVEARYRRDALHRFRAHPGAHLLATVAVGWRGLFAERSPAVFEPFDFKFEIGLLVLAALVLFTTQALARRSAPRLAWLLPSAIVFCFHALGTEFLPRYAIPLLPCAWVAVAVLLFGAARAEPARRAASDSEGLRDSTA